MRKISGSVQNGYGERKRDVHPAPPLTRRMALAAAWGLAFLPAGARAQEKDQEKAQLAAKGRQPGKPLVLAVFGDSLTAGYGLPASAAFPAVLEAALRARGHAVEIRNAGVSGDTAGAGLQRLDWSIGEGVDGVIIELGANDALRGLDPAQTRQALNAILDRLKARRIPAMLSGMLAPPNYGEEYAKRFNGIYPDIAAARGLILDPFFLEGVAGKRELNQLDGLHPTAEGVKRIVARILPVVERFIASLGA